MNRGTAATASSPPGPQPGQPAGIRSLADLLAPVSTETFYAEYWGRKPLHIPGSAAKLAPIMSWDILTALLNQAGIWSPNTLKLMMDAEPVPSRSYCRSGPTREGPSGLVVDLSMVRSWLQRGASLVLNRIDTLAPGLREMADALARETCAPIQSNLYCSWRAHQAFPLHFDTHDVFALHIAGEKAWRIYQRHIEAPVRHPRFTDLDQAFHTKHRGALSQSLVLRPGDVLYIPRGFYHEALATSGGTIHLSTAVVPMNGLDLITALFERALLEPLFRQSIPNPAALGEQAFGGHVDALVKRIGELFGEPSFRKKVHELLASHGGSRTELRLPEDGAGDGR